MRIPAHFDISLKNQLLRIDLNGDWTKEADRKYLTSLMSYMYKASKSAWGMLVDMRGWYVSEELIAFKHKYEFHLDRHNQKVECWIVQDDKQGSHLRHFIEQPNITFKLVKDEESASEWLKSHGFKL